MQIALKIGRFTIIRPGTGPLWQLGTTGVPSWKHQGAVRARRGERWSTSDAFYSQLEDSAAGSLAYDSPEKIDRPQTLTEKIVQKFACGLAPGKLVKSGDYITLQPARCMTHDNTWPVATKFMGIGATKIADPEQLVFTLDHDVQNKGETNMKKYQNIETFARQHHVAFYPAGRGIGHQIMVEEGYAWPGSLAVASDSHTNMYGGIGCLGTPIVRTDAASIWATGKTWWQVPPIAQVTFTGALPRGVTGKDIIIALCGLFSKDQVLNHAIEFTGSEQTLSSLSVDDRLTIANMTTEWGALSGLFPIDKILKGWLRAKATEFAMYESAELSSSSASTRINHDNLDKLFETAMSADPGAKYAKHLSLDLNTLSPHVAGPNSVKVATPLHELDRQNIKVDKAYLVSCTNSRRSDIAAAAKVFKDAATASKDGKIPRIPDHVQFYIAAASIPEQNAAEEQGDWQALLDAGAQALPSGCGPCIGLGTGLLEPGEVGISASNRNFKGRMGSPSAKAYLASPEVVAASALQGRITGPGWYERPVDWNGVRTHEGEEFEALGVADTLSNIIGKFDDIIAAGITSGTPSGKTANEEHPEVLTEVLTEVLPGFPEKIIGEIIFCDADNVNTDVIYPGKYTYQDDVPRWKMAEVVMENYDASFASIAKKGDILVSGFNFGCGSSREQAATAILAKAIPLVVAGSFGNIFSRNSINNALMGLEVPKLIQRLRAVFGHSHMSKELSRRTGWTLEWDVRRSQVTVQEGQGGQSWTQKVGELPPNVQEIIAMGGLENWIKGQISKAGL